MDPAIAAPVLAAVSGRGAVMSSGPGLHDVNVHDAGGIVGPIVAVAGFAGDLFD